MLAYFMDKSSAPITIAVKGKEFRIPVSYHDPKAPDLKVPFLWSISIDGEFYCIVGGDSHKEYGSIPVSFEEDGPHIIEITPSDGVYSAGWGAAFSFSDGQIAANTPENKLKLVEVLSDPDWAHAYVIPGSRILTAFRHQQYNGCYNLVAANLSD